MTLNSFLESLSAASPTASLMFKTEDGDVGPGYHVTEFKLATIKGVDCGVRVAEWQEASMQLLDGKVGPPMQVGKFAGILRQSIAHLDGLGAAPVRIEFAPRNVGLRTYEMDDPEIQDDRVLVSMRESRALCKPASGQGASRTQCCAPDEAAARCCA